MVVATVTKKNTRLDRVLGVVSHISDTYPDMRLEGLTANNLTPDMRKVAYEYLRQYKGTSGGTSMFLMSVKQQAQEHAVSDKQLCVVWRIVGQSYRRYLERSNQHLEFRDGIYRLVANTAITTTHQIYAVPQCGTYTVLLENGTYRTLKIRPGKRVDTARIIQFLNGSDNLGSYGMHAWLACTDDPGKVRLQVRWRYRNASDLLEATDKLLRGEPDSILKAATCNRCGRLLTHPSSIALGLGPECAQK